MRSALLETNLGLRNSTTRLPFRYGSACLTRCPQALLSTTIRTEQGRQATGFAGDCFPPGWFDKSPGKDFAAQIADMLTVIGLAEAAFQQEMATPVGFFPAWRAAYEQVQHQAAQLSLTPLLASFGISLVERAVIDGLCRAAGKSLHQAIRENLLGIQAGEIHPALAKWAPADWLPQRPVTSIHVRHTVGLIDPLTAADIPRAERLADAFPQALDEYIDRLGIRYFKIKVSNRLEQDLERLIRIAQLAEFRWGPKYAITLDGNEQYKSAEEFAGLMDSMRKEKRLDKLCDNILAIEQPLERSIALSQQHTGGVKELGKWQPVIIDESDGLLDSYPQALELGYRGVSSKNCKGPIKSILNAGLTWLRNGRSPQGDYLITGEDLCTVGVVPVQSDLALVATLGLTHVERNGHHYHPGLSYLPEEERLAALAAHRDFYAEQGGLIAPRVVDGKFEIGSLQCTGYGFASLPDMSCRESATEWSFESLGLSS